MGVSLYDATVPGFRQVLGGLAGVLDKGARFCSEQNIHPNDFAETRLFEDMLPLKHQVLFTYVHSYGAIEAAKNGVFIPPRETPPPQDYAGMQKCVADALEGLAALTPDDVNALQGRDMVFQLGENKLPFIAENFLFSFSTPNFHFHATTAYDILRMRGVPLGKRDYLGQLRMKA
ncbi:MAG: DUF1993 family protein [Alphaproteobacteria bacterium]|nr:DUF1993 family protein [Alphaproteobacteria bacterium]